MVRANLRVLIDFKYISFLTTNSKKPSFFEAQIPWNYFKQEIFLLFSVLYSFLVHSGTQQFCGIFKNSRHVHQAAIFTTQQGPTILISHFSPPIPFGNPHRLLKRQSLTTVLLRTPITQMIFFNQSLFVMHRVYYSYISALS